jgi:putative transcriptional regulator
VYDDDSVAVKDISSSVVKLPFGLWGDEATINDVNEFLETRCFPRTRGNCKQILKSGDIQFYNPLEICRKTQGRMSDDGFWIRFHDEVSEG